MFPKKTALYRPMQMLPLLKHRFSENQQFRESRVYLQKKQVPEKILLMLQPGKELRSGMPVLRMLKLLIIIYFMIYFYSIFSWRKPNSSINCNRMKKLPKRTKGTAKPVRSSHLHPLVYISLSRESGPPQD